MWIFPEFKRFHPLGNRITTAVATVLLLISCTPNKTVTESSQKAIASTPTTPSGAIAPTSDPVIAAAGDISCNAASGTAQHNNPRADTCQMRATSDLILNSQVTAVLPLGDEQYDNGALADFQQSYDLTWGRLNSIAHPVPGNHEYHTSGASGYFRYFGAIAGDPAKGYYSYDLVSWHLVALNSTCSAVGGCGANSPQVRWLKADLAAHPSQCTLAYWHQPRFSSGPHGSDRAYDAFWQALYAAGAEVVLNGHDHTYERFAPQAPGSRADAAHGIREFVVGTGGRSVYSFTSTQPNSEVRKTGIYGVLKLTLHPDSYDWEFSAIPGTPFTDSGHDSCH
ncbi:MAG TPA: metallophosphoesterase [Crinalium sp.]